MVPVCNLDLDGVLINFVKASLALHNATLEPMNIQYDYWKQLGLSAADFWKPFTKDTWANMEWTVEGKELLAGIEVIFGKENILLTTAPSPTKFPDTGSCPGKLEWLERNLPYYYETQQYSLCPAKHLQASPHHVLVDDAEPNLKNYRHRKGLIVRIPRPWNIFSQYCNPDGTFHVATTLQEIENRYKDVL